MSKHTKHICLVNLYVWFFYLWSAQYCMMEDQDFIIGIGKNIAKVRKRKKMTQRDLATLVELEEQSIWRIENGTRNNYTIKTLLKISRALGINIRDLLNVK